MLDAGVLARKRELHDQLVALAREERKTMVLGTSEAEAVSAVLKTAAGKKLYAEYDALQPGPA
jgi:acetylornithine/succinyldiaminopimelate/putrescine aminotransferase